ncbi:MAG TPA: HAMP domain-containing sensor histidine kinase [Candidatus Binatia bacterium]|nr:HAMP domain-containing sensor histidine kinase [Candidatus Binatia bacterium]
MRAARQLRPRLRLGGWLAIALGVAGEVAALGSGGLADAHASRGNLLLVAVGCLVLAALRWPPLRARAREVALAGGCGFAIALALRAGAGDVGDGFRLAGEASALLLGFAALIPIGWRPQVVLGAVTLGAASTAIVGAGGLPGTALRGAVTVAVAATAATLIAGTVEATQKKMLARLERLRRRSQRAPQAPVHDERIAHLSHDLRNPLAVAFGYSEMAGDHELPEEERTRALGRVKRSLWELTQMVENVLESSADEAGSLVLAAGPVEASALCEELCASVQVLTRGKPLHVQALAEPGLVVMADRQRLMRVLSNLLGNAIKYTDAGEVTLRATRSGDRALFEVCDTGPGIAPDQISQIFDRYRQVPGTARGGVGLGLAISRMLTERMGGSLDAASVPGRGSRFTVSLPTAEAARRAAHSAAA